MPRQSLVIFFCLITFQTFGQDFTELSSKYFFNGDIRNRDTSLITYYKDVKSLSFNKQVALPNNSISYSFKVIADSIEDIDLEKGSLSLVYEANKCVQVILMLVLQSNINSESIFRQLTSKFEDTKAKKSSLIIAGNKMSQTFKDKKNGFQLTIEKNVSPPQINGGKPFILLIWEFPK
jgi:hypothetical protein